MNEQQVEDLLRSIGCWQTGHFVLRSGKHSGDYMNNDPLMESERVLDLLGQAIAERVVAADVKVRCVTGPAEGGLRLAVVVAKHLAELTGRKVSAASNTKVTGSHHSGFDFAFAEEAKLRMGPVLVVEDTVTTGGSLNKILDLVHEARGQIVAVACILNRGDVTVDDLGVPQFLRLLDRKLPAFDPGSNPGDFAHSGCPLCKSGVQIDLNIGNGRPFIDAFGQPPPKSL